MNKNKRINYLAIAITTNCNCNCFYCKSTGESILSNMKGTLNFQSLKKIVKVAYELGITTFRITGGEPTTVSYLPSLICYIMKLGDNTKIRLNTNGYKLDDEELLTIIESYKERIDIVISVDSVNEYIQGIHYPKYLSLKVQNLAIELVKRKIPTRFNVVVTRQNINEIKALIDKSIALGVNIKILDLIIQNEYFGTNKNLNGEEMTLASFNGKYTLLDFWGTWCGWCIKGMPDMKKYYAKYKNKMEIVGICCRDTENKWREGVENLQLPWTNLYNGNDDEIVINYAVTGYPTKILIDPQGKIVEVFVGESEELYKKLDMLFK